MRSRSRTVPASALLEAWSPALSRRRSALVAALRCQRHRDARCQYQYRNFIRRRHRRVRSRSHYGVDVEGLLSLKSSNISRFCSTSLFLSRYWRSAAAETVPFGADLSCLPPWNNAMLATSNAAILTASAGLRNQLNQPGLPSFAASSRTHAITRVMKYGDVSSGAFHSSSNAMVLFIEVISDSQAGHAERWAFTSGATGSPATTSNR